MNWSMELSEFDIEYAPRTAVEGQVLAEFVAEFIGIPGETEQDPRQSPSKSSLIGCLAELEEGRGCISSRQE